jgi:hypothetical protein
MNRLTLEQPTASSLAAKIPWQPTDLIELTVKDRNSCLQITFDFGWKLNVSFQF